MLTVTPVDVFNVGGAAAMIRVQPVVRPAITVTCACPVSSVIAAPRFRIFLNDRDIVEIGCEGHLRVGEGKPLRIGQCRREG